MADRFANTSPGIVASVEAGCSIEEAARASGVPVASVRRWLRDGRKGKSPYDVFAVAVDAARGGRREAERALDGPLSADEAELLVAKAARKGSVPALRLYFELRMADDASSRGASARERLREVFGGDR
jgi:hypothetical protein